MSVGDVAGLIAAIAFVLLVGFLAVPLIKLGRVLDETRTSVKEITDHTVPVLDETATLVASSNTQLENIDTSPRPRPRSRRTSRRSRPCSPRRSGSR